MSMTIEGLRGESPQQKPSVPIMVRVKDQRFWGLVVESQAEDPLPEAYIFHYGAKPEWKFYEAYPAGRHEIFTFPRYFAYVPPKPIQEVRRKGPRPGAYNLGISEIRPWGMVTKLPERWPKTLDMLVLKLTEENEWRFVDKLQPERKRVVARAGHFAYVPPPKRRRRKA